jgi:hypothetical protein
VVLWLTVATPARSSRIADADRGARLEQVRRVTRDRRGLPRDSPLFLASLVAPKHGAGSRNVVPDLAASGD